MGHAPSSSLILHQITRITWLTLYITASHIVVSQAQAPVHPITSSGLNTQISEPVVVSGRTQYDITGGTRAGANLFHSFENFSVPPSYTANFLNSTDQATHNILGRVTGENISTIFGTIQTTGFGNANLFLMNPAGIVLGPNASLNVGGSVTLTTADYLRLSDNRRFNAIPNATADALFSTAPVSAYGFLGSNPRAITLSGSQLTVQEGAGISLVGGNITIESSTSANSSAPAKLSAPGGEIHMASVSSPGEITLGTLDYAPNINGHSFTELGNIRVSQKSVINSSGNGGGEVLIRGGRFVIDDSRVSANVTGLGTVHREGQNIDIRVSQDATIRNAAILETNVDPHISLGSGGVHIRANGITILGIPGSLEHFGAQPFTGIKSNTQGNGSAGHIVLNATGDIKITNVVNLESTSGFNSDGTAGTPFLTKGNAGNVELTSTHGNILLTQGGRATVVTSQTLNSSGDTGSVITSAPEGDIVLNGANLFTQLTHGRGGQVEITAKNLQMNESLLSNDNDGSHKPDGIKVTLSGKLTMESASLFFTSSISPTSAPAADINIAAKDLLITQGSFISNATFASGAGGHLKIVTDTLQIMDGGKLANGSVIAPALGGLPQGVIPSGLGGDITIQTPAGATGSVLIDGSGSGIFTNTEGTGAGGTTILSAKSVTIQNGGKLSAETTGISSTATGGAIIVNATDQVTLTNGASITASTSGPGNAGDILVKANDIALSGGSSVTASSTGTGNAGTVTIQGLQSSAHSLLIDGVNSGIFTRTSNTGTGGDIAVSANSVRMLNQSSISGETSGTTATATGGKIRVEGNTIHIEKGSLVTSSSTDAGSGGNIKLTAGQSVSIFDGASISASSTGTGAAGNIEIDAGLELDVQRGSITTQSTELSGGNIDIRAIDLLRVVDGKISTSALNGGGNGGAITIDPKVVLLQNSDILAQANRGNGGDISITTPVFVADQSSRVDASTPFGLNGRVTIQAPTSNLSGTVGQLVSKTSPPQVLLQNRCVALAGGEQSTFLLAGRETLPVEPSGWLSSPVSMEHWTGEEAAHASRLMVRNRELNASAVMTAQTSRTPVLSLRRLTPPGFLVRTFAPGVTGCPS